MVVYFQQFRISDKVVYTTACQRCGSVIGDLSGDEVAALSTGKFGPVLCFDCEVNSCAICHKELTEREWSEELPCGYGDGVMCWFCYQEFLQGEKSLEGTGGCGG